MFYCWFSLTNSVQYVYNFIRYVDLFFHILFIALCFVVAIKQLKRVSAVNDLFMKKKRIIDVTLNLLRSTIIKLSKYYRTLSIFLTQLKLQPLETAFSFFEQLIIFFYPVRKVIFTFTIHIASYGAETVH